MFVALPMTVELMVYAGDAEPAQCAHYTSASAVYVIVRTRIFFSGTRYMCVCVCPVGSLP